MKMILMPENTSKKIDSLGRITLPKGLRARLCLEEGMDMAFYTANVDDKLCVVLLPADVNVEFDRAVKVIESMGYEVVKK